MATQCCFGDMHSGLIPLVSGKPTTASMPADQRWVGHGNNSSPLQCKLSPDTTYFDEEYIHPVTEVGQAIGWVCPMAGGQAHLLLVPYIVPV